MPWTPSTTLLDTVREFQSFSHSIEYYEEFVTPGVVGPDGIAGAGTTTQTYYPVVISQVTPHSTVITTDGSSNNNTVQAGSISGLYRYIFFDTITYKNFNKEIVTAHGTDTLGTWEQVNMNDVYQMIEFIPDSNRFRTFQFLAEAKNANGTTRASQTYTIDVSDRNWTPGKNALQNAVAIIRARGQ